MAKASVHFNVMQLLLSISSLAKILLLVNFTWIMPIDKTKMLTFTDYEY